VDIEVCGRSLKFYPASSKVFARLLEEVGPPTTKLLAVARAKGDIEAAAGELVHVELERVSPLAVPLLVMIGRESVPAGMADEELLLEAESLASAAMRPQ
jgi:hypothetical protein